jgi:hypothetical protein
MIRLKRLVIHKWRNVAPGTALDFADGINVILGKNGTGKTHLLDLISVVVRGDFNPIEEEKFDIEYEISFRTCERITIRANSTGRRNRGGPPGALWTCDGKYQHIAITCNFSSETGRSVKLSVGDEGPQDLEAVEQEIRSIDLFSGELNSAVVQLVAQALGIVSDRLPLVVFSEAFRFDEHLEMFKAITAPMGDEDLYVLGTPYRVADGEMHEIEEVEPIQDMIDGAELHAEYVAPATEMIFGRLVPQPQGWEHSLARSFEKCLDFHEVSIRMKMITAGQFHGVDISFIPTDGGERFETIHSLSFGQKRMFVWMYLSQCAIDGPLIADELTNGLHHSLIDACIEEIGDRQAFLAAQEPLVLDYLEFESAREVRDTFVICRSDRDNRGKWVWEKPAESLARYVFQSYEVDLKHVSEILRTYGLW